MMLPRLIFAILTTAMQEAAIALIVLLALPRLGIRVPVGALVVVMVAWAASATLVYRAGSHALKKKPVAGLSPMVGCTGKAVTPLKPEGTIRVVSELWAAKSADGSIDAGEEVVVVGQDGLKLIVRKRTTIAKSRPDDERMQA